MGPAPDSRSFSPTAGGGARLDPHTPIDFDILCQRCAYNLRGLLPSGRCPECGVPVRVSIAGELLQFADPTWIKRLATGGTLVRAILILLIIASIPTTGLGLRDWRYGRLSVLLVAAVIPALLVGAWLLATPNPLLRKTERWRAPRRILRAVILINGLSVAFSVVLLCAQPWNLRWLWVQLAAGPLGAVGLVGIAALGQHVRSLARRLGDDRTAGQARAYVAIYVLSWGVSAAGFGLGFVGDEAVCLLVPAVPAALVSAILALSLPARLVGELNRCRKEAEINWQAAAEDVSAAQHATPTTGSPGDPDKPP
jgi:hypothetical protein